MKKLTEILTIRNKCNLLLDFMKNAGANEVIEAFQKVVDKAFEEKNLRGLKMLLRDLSEWANDFNGGVETLKIINEVNQDVLNEISRILESGKISTADEYRVLLNFVDEHFDDPVYKNLVAKIKTILENPSDWIKGDLSEE